MSFDSSPNGLDPRPFRSDGTGSDEYVEYFEGFDTDGVKFCDGMQCPGPTAVHRDYTILNNCNPALDADYYAFNSYFYGPRVIGAGCHEPFGPTDIPCGGTEGDESYYSGEIDLAPWMKKHSDGSYGIVPPTFEANYLTFPSQNRRAFTEWPDPSHPLILSAFLVNPSPVWPSPDAVGNEFGQCLFTYDQLPEAITMSIDAWCHHEINPVRWHIAVIAYDVVTTFPGEGHHYGSIIHWA